MKINENQSLTYWTYLVGVFLITALPLLNLPPLFFPPAWAQSIVFRITFLILLFVFVKSILLKPSYLQEVKNKITSIPPIVSIPLVSYLVLIVLSTIFSLQPFFSFWGSPYRGDGSFNLILYIIFAFFAYITIKSKDWIKIWFFSFAIGIIVSLIAFAQQFNLLPADILVSYSNGPPSTLGNTNLLAGYLALLIFIAFYFGIKQPFNTPQGKLKKIFLFFSIALFLSAMLLTMSRAGFLGIILGSGWMIFFYRIKNNRINKIKNIFGITMVVLMCIFVYYANTAVLPPPNGENGNNILHTFFSSLDLKGFENDGRFSSWRMVFPGLYDNPLLGVGPENFSIVFDKYFDPTLSYLVATGGQWWDRAHNFMLEIALGTGIPSLLIYLFFWTALFIFLQKNKQNNPDNYLAIHSIQATIIAYLTINFFGFDSPATYIFSFLLVGYAFYHLQKSQGEPTINNYQEKSFVKNSLSRKSFLAIILLFLVIFIWQYAIAPLKINSKINWANYYLEQKKDCSKAYETLKPYLNSKTYINTYSKQIYAYVIATCVLDEEDKNKKENMVKEGLKIAEEITKQKPYYTRTWIYLGIFKTYMLEKDPSNTELQKEVNYAFEKATTLSFKRNDIFYEWGRAYLTTNECQKSLEIANTCLSKNSNSGECWWLSAISNLCLGKFELYKEQENSAFENNFSAESSSKLKQTLKFLLKLIENEGPNKVYYEELAKTYNLLTVREPKNVQNHASLAYVYKELGRYKQAREHAMITLRMSPELEAEVKAFLNSLPY